VTSVRGSNSTLVTEIRRAPHQPKAQRECLSSSSVASSSLELAAMIVSLENRSRQEPQRRSVRQDAQVIVRRGSLAGAPVTVPVADVQAGVFTSDGTKAIVVHVWTTPW